MQTSSRKSIFITGSSSGLGRATAKLFASKGWYVVATMRNPARETELNHLDGVTLLPLDVTDPNQIASAVQRAIETSEISVVFNNAGYGLAGPLEGTTDEQIVRIINTNLLGPIRITKAFIPYFRAKRSGVFINTSSVGGLVAVPFNSMYHATKWALEGWSESMTFELSQFGIFMKNVLPGGMTTDFFTRSLDSAKHEAYDDLVNKVMSMIGSPQQMQAHSSPEQIANVVYEAATDGKDQLRYVAGEDAKAMHAMRLQAGDEAFRKGMAQQFFGNT